MFQNATQNSLELLDDPKAAAVDEIAAKLGLCKVVLGSGFLWTSASQIVDGASALAQVN